MSAESERHAAKKAAIVLASIALAIYLGYILWIGIRF